MATTISYASKIAQQQDALTATYITESSEWATNIYEIQEEDYVHGGTHGYDNVPHEQLANRTTYLYKECVTINQSIDAFKQQVDAQDLQNQTHFTAIRNDVTVLTTDVTNLTNRVNNIQLTQQNQIDALRTDLTATQNKLDTHTHLYAGADVAGGDANTVKIQDDLSNALFLTGNTTTDKNKLFKNKIYSVDNTLYVDTIKGINTSTTPFLEGTAKTANRLTNPVDIKLYGDVVATYTFDGSQSIHANTTISKSGVTAGVYGPNTSSAVNTFQLVNNDTFYVPMVTVNDKGIVTAAKTYKYILPDETISGTTNATDDSITKLFIVGAPTQNPKTKTYTQANAYELNGKLYSNNYQVINTSDTQALTNKTYNGYTLKDACAKDVETYVQGVNGEYNKLVTSHALFNHKHNYAGSDSYGGSANKVKITQDDINKLYLTANNAQDELFYNTQVEVQGNEITCDVIHANSMMHIPGGRVWIDTSAQAVDGSSFSSTTLAQISTLQNDVDNLKSVINARTVAVTFNVAKGDILSYQKGGFVLANNSQEKTLKNLVIATESNNGNTVKVANMYSFDTDNKSYDGADCYVTTNGKFSTTKPTSGYVKKVGYFEEDILIFQPEMYAITTA